MPPFDLNPLNRVVFGAGSLARLGELVAELGIRRALIVGDPGLTAVGYPKRASHIIREAGVATDYFDGVQENPTEGDCRKCADVAQKFGADGFVAIGGGSAMDCAKGANFLLTNGGRIQDYQGHNKATKPMLPSIGVPTTAGTGSEAQSYALITDESTHMKMACGDRKAAFRVCLLDPELTATMPVRLAAITAIDAVSHAIESHVCTKANPWSHTLSRRAFGLLANAFDRAIGGKADVESRGAMLLGAHLAGMAIENAMLGIAHSCANPMTAHYGTPHGVAIGLMLPGVIRYNSEVVSPLYSELASEDATYIGRSDAAEFLASRIEGWMQRAALPARLREAGIGRDILPLLAEEASTQWTARFNPRPVGHAELLEVYRRAW